VNGIVQKYAPQKLILIEVDSWFGSKWLGLSGKIMGRLGVRTEPLSVSPFVPARIFSQRRFISPDYTETETDAGDPVHITVSSSVGKRRKLTEIEPRLQSSGIEAIHSQANAVSQWHTFLSEIPIFIGRFHGKSAMIGR
jgi:hypothetical protein